MLDIIGDTSELSIRRQVAHLNSIISAVLPLGYPMMVLNGGHVAINTDTHGDFFSLLSSLVECGAVIISENDFMYYDTLNNSYLTQKEFDELNIDADAEHSGFCVFPKPYPNPKFKAKYYHLGDIGDRDPENVMSFAFLYNLLERYEKERGVGKFPVYLTLGNHESKDCGFGAGANGAKSHPLYLPILTKMIFKNYIKTGYVLGAADCTIALWHARYLTESLPVIFKDLKDLFDSEYTAQYNSYSSSNARLIRSIKSEFSAVNISLYNKLNSFFRKNEISIENILKTFSLSELANLKIILGDGILKSNIDEYRNLIPGFTITDSIVIGTTESGSEKLFLNSPSVRGNINPLFWCDEKCLGDPVIEQAVGHDTHEMKLSRKEAFGKKIVDFDITRSCGFYSFVANNKYAGRSLSSTFYYELGMYGNFDPSELSTYTAYTLFREMPDSKDMLPSVDKRKNCFFRNRIGLDGVRNIGIRFENIATAYSSSEVERIIIEYNNREKILNGDSEQQYAACSLCVPKLFKGIDYNELNTNAMNKEEKSLDGIAMSCTQRL